MLTLVENFDSKRGNHIIMVQNLSKQLFSLVFFLSACFFIQAQESPVTINHEGKDVFHLKHAWNAQWLTHPTASTLDYGVFLYRRNFDLAALPKEFIVYVSADNRYKLYINGHLVSNGPARGDINHWRYETVDIAKYLTLGKNTLAAEVVNFGEFKHAAQISFQTAFILQGHTNNSVSVNTATDGTWKITKNKAYNFIPFVSDSLGGYYAAGPGDIVNAKLYPWGWNQTDYDDSNWPAPRPATVEFAVGRGFLFGSTWYLVPREIPFMEEEITRFSSLVRTTGIKSDNAFLNGNNALIIPANSKVSILLDNKNHTIGYPEIILSKGKTSKVKITYAEALFYKKSTSYSAHGGWKKGHRNEDWQDKEIRGYYDIIYPDGGTKRKFKPLAMRTYRFVQLDITTKEEPLIIEDFYGVYTAYPFKEKAKFQSDDKNLDKIWDVSWRTLRNSSAETFIDPYYEQLQYVGDSRIEALVSIYVSGDDRLMRKAIKSFDDSRLPMGLTASRFPSYIVQIIPTYSLLWVDMIHDYYMYRDDPEFLRAFLPGMKTTLEWFEQQIDETGMLGPLEWWNFTDWTKGFQNGIPPGADDGHSANVSLQYVYALQNAAAVYRHFGWEETAIRYENLAQKVKKAVVKHCYDSTKNLIAERPEKDVFSQHSNIFAILTDAIPVNEQQDMIKTILSDTSLIQTSIYFKFYLTRALQKAGMADLYLDQLEPWDYMLSQGMTTFGETDKDPRSDCHAWSASPCFEFLHTVAGIQPKTPSFKEVLIAPNLGKLNKISAVFPHLKGEVKVDLHKNGKGNLEGEVHLPAGLFGEFVYKNTKIALVSGVNVIR